MNEDRTPGPDGADQVDKAPRESRVSRAQFLVAAGGVAAGAAVGAPLASAARRASTVAVPRKWDRTADVVVVGSGAAAFAAAVTARSQGKSVLMLEKATQVGGTTAKSGGGYWIPNNSLMQAKGLADPRDDAIRYMARLSYPSIYDPAAPTLGLSDHQYGLIATYYDTGSVAIDAFAKLGALQSKLSADVSDPNAVTYPDYHADLPEDKAPRGRPLGPTTGAGAGLINQMQTWAQKNNIAILVGQRVTNVFVNGKGEVVGVKAEAGSKQIAVRARRAIVFGSGGFTQNPDMALNHLRGPIFGGCAVPTNTGDFVNIGIGLGAALANMNHAFWAQNALESALQFSSVPNDIWIPYGDSMVQVNKYGERVSSEKMVYNERTQAHFYWDAPRSEYRNLVLFHIYDSAVANDPTAWAFRYPVPLPGTTSPLVISGNTWEELATNINARLQTLDGKMSVSGRIGPGVRLDSNFVGTLKDTIARFNQFAQTGVDLDYGRGSTPIQLAWSGPARAGNTKNPTMYPFSSSGPYYCILIGGGTLDTKGGPVINNAARVLRPDGSVIRGLYGAGNCIASPAGQAYWSGGGTIGPALTYGYIAGMNAAKEPVKSV